MRIPVKVAALLLLFACGGSTRPPLDFGTDQGGVIPEVNKDIPGCSRAAFHGALEQRGFDVFYVGRVGKDVVGWNCTLDEDSLELQVELYSGWDTTAIQCIRATVRPMGGSRTAKDGLDFLVFVAGLACDGSDAVKAKQWTLDNWNTNGATTTIGSAKFRVWATSETLRALWIDGV